MTTWDRLSEFATAMIDGGAGGRERPASKAEPVHVETVRKSDALSTSIGKTDWRMSLVMTRVTHLLWQKGDRMSQDATAEQYPPGRERTGALAGSVDPPAHNAL